MNEYFTAPSICKSKGGVLDYTCEFHAKKAGNRSVCLYKKTWKYITANFICPNKEWQKDRVPVEQKK